MNLDQLTAYLHARIPLTRSLGAAAIRRDDASLALAAPLSPNLNQVGTAFGGSLSALAIVAGWALVHVVLRDRGVEARLVIQRSAMEFVAPAEGELVATATLPSPEAWGRFLATLARHGRARVSVPVTVASGGIVAATHDGAYAAFTR